MAREWLISYISVIFDVQNNRCSKCDRAEMLRHIQCLQPRNLPLSVKCEEWSVQSEVQVKSKGWNLRTWAWAWKWATQIFFPNLVHGLVRWWWWWWFMMVVVVVCYTIVTVCNNHHHYLVLADLLDCLIVQGQVLSRLKEFRPHSWAAVDPLCGTI